MDTIKSSIMKLKVFVILFLASLVIGACKKEDEDTAGCTNTDAVNFNEVATIDDGSCIIRGCTNPSADNYNANANEDDGSCIDAREKFIGDWDVSDDCSTLLFSLQNTQTITMDETTLDQITISPLLSLSEGDLVATISGSNITIASQTVGLSTTVSGEGTINATKDAITINYAHDNGLPLGAGAGTCTAVYTKL